MFERKNLKYKKGFGLIEVLVASLVLGFLIVGLNLLQKGNRESLLRVRARDAATNVAQHILDSIAAAGLKSIDFTQDDGDKCSDFPVTESKGNDSLIYRNLYIYKFEGKPQLDKSIDGIKTETKYCVEVFILKETIKENKDTSLFTTKQNINEANTYSQSLEAKVSWLFKGSPQSVTIAKVVK